MFSNNSDIRAVNGKNRDVENMFALASNYRIFLMNLSFLVYLHLYYKYIRNQKFDFYREIFSPEPKENFTFLVSLFLSLLPIPM